MTVDLLIKNGHLLDATTGTDAIGDIALKEGRIVSIDSATEITAKEVYDAKGLYVVPGLIDFHAHVFYQSTDSGIQPDVAMIPAGVTAVVDQGSSGVVNYKSLLKLLDRSLIQSKIYMHVSPCGQHTFQYPEPLIADKWDINRFAKAFDEHGNRILGFKVRVSKHVVLDQGLSPYYEAVKISHDLNKSLCVHVTNPPEPESKVVSVLDAGDVFCHMYHGTGYTILDDDGKVLPEMKEARARGVIFDCAHGSANFSYKVAQAAMEQDFMPDIISTDLTSMTWQKYPTYDLCYIMSKFLMMGMPLNEIIRRVTTNPAKAMKMDGEIGTLRAGARGNITLLEIRDGEFRFSDTIGEIRTGTQLIVPAATIINGRISYRRGDIFLR